MTTADAIRYGWTLADLDALARAVVTTNRTWWPTGDRNDLYDAAWHGIVEHLYTVTEPPTRRDLMTAGRDTLSRDVGANIRHHGARRDPTSTGAKYAAYWEWASRVTPSPENTIIDRIALQQILTTLTPGQRAAINALAATGDYAEAARITGGTNALILHLTRGRRRFRELWHEGETPSRHWGHDRRAGATAAELTDGRTALNRMRRRARQQARKVG